MCTYPCLLVVAPGSNRVVAAIGRDRPARKLFLVEGGDASDPRQVPPGALRARDTSQPDRDDQPDSAGSHPATVYSPSSSLRPSSPTPSE